jgi:hypothetical protein
MRRARIKTVGCERQFGLRVSWLAFGCTLGFVCCGARPLFGQAPAMRVVMRVTGTQDAALLMRVRGQISDLAVDLVAVSVAQLEPEFAQQLASSRELLRTQNAGAVLWFARQDGAVPQLFVHLLAGDTGELITRQVAAEAARGSQGSDKLEAAALVAGSALSALLRARERREQTPGVALAPAAPVVAAEAANVAVASAVAPASVSSTERSASSGGADVRSTSTATIAPNLPEPESQVAPSAPASQLMAAGSVPLDQVDPALDQTVATRAPHRDDPNAPVVQVFMGAQSVIDGVSTRGQPGLAARAGLGVGVFGVTVFGSAALGSSIRDRYVDLQLSRHSAGAAFELATPISAHLRAALGLHAGAAFLVRTSSPIQANVQSTGSSRHVALALGPEASLCWLPGAVGVGLHLALDMVPNAPSYVIAGPNDRAVDTHRLWSLEPRASLGLEARLQ